MNNIVIYAAGPVDLGKDAPNWRALLMRKLDDYGVSAAMFDPSTAYKHSRYGDSFNRSRSMYIEEINRQALEQATAFVVCLPNDVPSVGTPIELDMAFSGAIPVFLMTDIEPGKSVYVDNRVSGDHYFYTGDVHDPVQLSTLLDEVVSALTLPDKVG